VLLQLHDSCLYSVRSTQHTNEHDLVRSGRSWCLSERRVQMFTVISDSNTRSVTARWDCKIPTAPKYRTTGLCNFRQFATTGRSKIPVLIWDLRRGLNEIFVLLGCYAM
jgi:hypothetical protein